MKTDKNLREWTELEIKILKILWTKGETAQQISGVLETKSRNAVIGKARRLNLESRPMGKNPLKVTKSKPKKKPPKEQDSKKVGYMILPSPTTKVVKHKKYKPTVEREKIVNTAYGHKCSLSDLKKHQCNWGVGDPKDKDFGFCGADKLKTDKNYCEKHASIAYA